MVTSNFRGNFAGDPPNKVKGDEWFDTIDNQFKGFDGTKNVIRG